LVHGPSGSLDPSFDRPGAVKPPEMVRHLLSNLSGSVEKPEPLSMLTQFDIRAAEIVIGDSAQRPSRLLKKE
jgi:hypothetical protein